MSTPAESNHEAPLTAADLDRLAHEWSERRVVFNGVEFRAKQDAARTERLVAALPSLLALARRGLEAEDSEGASGKCEACSKPATRSDEEGVPLCESCYCELVVEEYRDLAKKHETALAELERVKGRLADPSLGDVLAERVRQDAKWGEQNHDPFAYLVILGEEVGEMSQAALGMRFPTPVTTGPRLRHLRDEAVQTAAVALAIVECLDRAKWEWPVSAAEAHAARPSAPKGGPA